LLNTEPWNGKEAVMNSVKNYYKGLEFGGKIHSVGRSPSRFNYRWLCSKVGMESDAMT